MKALSIHTVVSVAAFASAATMACHARAGADLVTFPEQYASGVRYATVERGDVIADIFTSRSAIDAVKGGRQIPGGTVITLVEYAKKEGAQGQRVKGELRRYVVMEKRAGWGAGYPADWRNGEWEFQAFRADRSVNTGENLQRCFACHKPREKQDFVFTLDRMKAAH